MDKLPKDFTSTKDTYYAALTFSGNRGEKMGYSITVFLSLVVFLSIIGTHLPVNSEQVTVLGVYLVIQVALLKFYF